jgi:hypothetical protein
MSPVPGERSYRTIGFGALTIPDQFANQILDLPRPTGLPGLGGFSPGDIPRSRNPNLASNQITANILRSGLTPYDWSSQIGIAMLDLEAIKSSIMGYLRDWLGRL